MCDLNDQAVRAGIAPGRKHNNQLCTWKVYKVKRIYPTNMNAERKHSHDLKPNKKIPEYEAAFKFDVNVPDVCMKQAKKHSPILH